MHSMCNSMQAPSAVPSPPRSSCTHKSQKEGGKDHIDCARHVDGDVAGESRKWEAEKVRHVKRPWALGSGACAYAPMRIRSKEVGKAKRSAGTKRAGPVSSNPAQSIRVQSSPSRHVSYRPVISFAYLLTYLPSRHLLCVMSTTRHVPPCHVPSRPVMSRPNPADATHPLLEYRSGLSVQPK